MSFSTIFRTNSREPEIELQPLPPPSSIPKIAHLSLSEINPLSPHIFPQRAPESGPPEIQLPPPLSTEPKEGLRQKIENFSSQIIGRGK